MDMKSLKALSDDWVQLNEQSFAAPRTERLHTIFAQPIASAAMEQKPIPMLNWPPILFDDVAPRD
ncbi:hypothetical protein [Rhodopila sp.]|uniref:hypothetical protein n=1 Tax=Rhodopila sp. TaxID=2480087 RepID=UPI003D0AD94F